MTSNFFTWSSNPLLTRCGFFLSLGNEGPARKRRRQSGSSHHHASSAYWICLECKARNLSKQWYCSHCETKKNHHIHEKDWCVQKPSILLQQEWPPQFESHGRMFVFDKRSSMYYEPLSDFFYDPKTSLYYGNKLKTYFKYDSMYNPPFVAIYCHQTNESKPTSTNTNLPNSNDQAKHDTSLPKITVKLTTKKLPLTNESKQLSTVHRLPSGNPVCSLCMRKFKTVEQFRRHEKISDLHKANLAKKQSEECEEAKKKSISKSKTRRQHQQERKPIVSEFELLRPPQKPSWMN